MKIVFEYPIARISYCSMGIIAFYSYYLVARSHWGVDGWLTDWLSTQGLRITGRIKLPLYVTKTGSPSARAKATCIL